MKVRIYKSPDGNGKYLNKTGQFLEKAQKGKIVKDVLKYGKQLVMNFDEADKIQKATELAKAIDKSNRLARAAGAIKYGEGVKKAVTTSSKIHIKNPSYYQQILDMTNNLSPSTRQFHNDVLKSINRSKGMVSQKQYNILKNIENGTFNKYQLGGVPDVSEMGYPGSNSEQKKELSQDELVNIISNDLNNDIDEQQIAFKLANFYDVDPMEAINLVSQVKNYLNEQNDSEYEYDFDEDEDENEDEDEVVEEEVVTDPYESEDEVAAAEDTQNSNVATDLTLGDDEEDDDDDEEKYGGQMAYGGLYKAQDGEEVDESEEVNTEIQQDSQPAYPFNPTAPDLVFPEIETYLPYNMADMLNGNIDPATGTYYNHYASDDINQNSEYEDEGEVEKNPTYAEDQQYYEENNIPRDGEDYEENNIPNNDNVYGDYEEGEIIDPALDPNIIVNKYGGQMKMGGSYKRNKKVYVNSILKLAKKAEGGEEQESDNDPEAGDPTGAKIRKQKLNNFIGSLKKETEMFNLKQQAEQQYDQMMQQQQQPQQQQQMPPQNQMMQKGGSREPRVARGAALRYRANQLKNFITGQNRRDREDNIDYFNVDDYPTKNPLTSIWEEDKDKVYSTIPKIGQTYDDWWVTTTGETPGFRPDNRKWNGKDWISSKEYYGNSDYGNDMSYDKKPSYSIDVRKSNWLTGRPSKYKIDFYGYSPLVDISTGNNSGVISQKPVVKPSQSTVSSTIATTINKSQSTDLPKQDPLLPNGFFTIDANNDKIPDYLQLGSLSILPTGPVKEVLTQVEVDALNKPKTNIVKTSIKANVYKPERKKNSAPTIAEIKKNPSTIIDPTIIKNKTITIKEKKLVPKKPKVEYKEEYVDPTFMERLERFFDPSFENGGYVDSENPDLYEFNYGGYDPTQQDMDYSNSIDTTDPYFQRGGGVRKFIENYFPGNILSPQRTYRNEIQRVYDPRTGKTVNMPIDMGRLSSVDVQKSRFWSGKPKKYTMYFNGSTSKPVLTSNNSSSQSGHDRFCEMFPDSPMCTGIKKRDAQWNTTDGLGLKSRMAIRKGERWNKRNSRRLERQGLDEYGNRPGDEQGAIYNGDGKLVRNAEGDYFDRYNEKIPDKKRPTDMENWWQNDRYFKQNTKNNEPMSNEELFKSQGKTYDPILKKWLTADQRTAINMLNPESSIKNESLIKDESGNLKEQLQSNGIYNYKQLKKDFNEQDLEPLIKESKEKKYKKLISESPWEALEYKAAYNANMEYNKVYTEVYDKINSGQEVDPELTQLLKDKSDVAEKLRRAYSKNKLTNELDMGLYTQGRTLDDFDDENLDFKFYDQMLYYNELQEKLKEKTPAVEEDDMLPFEQQYMEGNEPIKNNFSNDGSPTEQQYIEDYETYFPAPIPQPAVNPFDFPEVSFAQPTVLQPAQEPTQPSKSGKSLDQVRRDAKKNPNYGKEYTYKFDMSGAKNNTVYKEAIAKANKDGVVTEQERANAFKIYDSYTAEAEKSKLASQAQRIRTQIDSSNASASEKKAAKNKVNAELQRRWDIIDNNIQQRFETSYQDSTKFGNKQYGGNLDKYLPRADTGFQTTLNPGDCPTGSSKNAAGDCIDFMGKVVKKRPTGSDFGNNTPEIKQPPEIKLPGVMDETYKNPLTGEKPGVIRGADGNLKINQETPSFYGDQYAVDVENKSDRGKLAFGNKADTSRSETRLGAFNTGVDIVDSLKRNIDSRKSENQMYENLSSNNLYASDPSRDRGDYDTNSGLYRPDDQGQMWDSRSKKFGGYIDEEEYYDPYTEEDEEDELTYAKGGEKITYMSEDQIRAFMAEGGQVEFL